jgi:predicted nucleotidyltransferase
MLVKQAGLAYDRLMEEVSALIDVLKGDLRSYPHIRLAVAFGSRARGDARPTSDLDIAVELTPDSSLLDIGALVDRITTLTALKVDIVELAGLPESDPLMAYNIAKDGIPLIEKNPGAFLEFRNRACITYFDVQEFLAEQKLKLNERLQENTFGRPRYA